MGHATAPSILLVLALTVVSFSVPVNAFGAGFVAKGASNKGTNFRHGDILYAVYFLSHAHSTLVRQIYFGNWLRDFSQLMDRKAMEAVPEPILRAVVSVFAYIQFGYTTKEFEVTTERLGYYRPEEHIDNPRGYEGGTYSSLRPSVFPEEIAIDPTTGMKNYIANPAMVHVNETSRDFIDRQLVAAIACGRARDAEAYTHLGAALHALEDFTAHSNWVELCMQMLSVEMAGASPEMDEMSKVFQFTGGAATINTLRGRAPPLVTGTFGALDLYQTVLGEFDDKLSSMSLPSIQMRMKDSDESLSTLSKTLLSLFSSLGDESLAGDIKAITKSATEKPADWGRLVETPELLWQQLYPVFRLRDKIVRWVYDHLTINSVADAVAKISTALDKLVYRIIGTFLGPVLKDISAALTVQSNYLQAQDQKFRLAMGEDNVFENNSYATDPTHSQLCKDHYDHDLNEIAGRVATKITTFTIKSVIELWQPGSNIDPRPALDLILSTLHHPFNYSKENMVQSIMVAEVLNWTTTTSKHDPRAFSALLSRLDRPHMAAKLGEQAESIAHSHVPSMTAAYAAPNQISGTTAHDLVTYDDGTRNISFVERIATNIEKSLTNNKIPGLGAKDWPAIKELLYASPSSDAPNPIDRSLTMIPGTGLLSAFEDIGVGEIVAGPGMGILLKDSIIAMRLRDTEWVDREQLAAQKRLGSLEDRPTKEMLKLLDFGAVPKSTARPVADVNDDGIGGEKESRTARLMQKLKIGKSSSDV